jgi:multiple sugar transport system substrate-binding protein
MGALLATAAATALLAACGSSGKGPVTLNWYVFPEPSGSFQAAATECTNNSHGA